MIKKIFFCVCGGMFIAQSVYGQIGKVKSLNQYQLITAYSDEFNGTTLNTAKWRDYDQASGRTNGEYVYLSPTCNQVGVGSNGANVLKLIAKKEFINATDWYGVPHDHFYQAGAAVSKTFFEQGYYEIRAKIPNSRNTNGMAFWFWDRDTSGVYSEIDVFETQPVFRYRYPTATHFDLGEDPNNPYNNTTQNCGNTTTDITDGWHTYGVEWRPDVVTFYIDGIIVNQNTLSVGSLRKMRLVLANVANFGIEASTTGDVMEIDYFRYYKRKPSVYFSGYNATTGEYMYASKSNTPSDVLTWTYGSDIKDVNSYNAFGIQYLTFKRVAPTGTISITANAHQIISSQDNNSNTTTQEITTHSTFTVGNDNAYFYTDDPYFLNGKNAIKAYAASPNTSGIWTIGLKNTFSGIIDWSVPQTQTGTSATFTNLLSGQTYVIKHQEPAAGSHLVLTEMTKEVAVSFNSEFYVNKVQSVSPSSNTVQMLVHQASTNPDSEWHLWLINSDGSVNITVDQPQWGASATFNNLVPGNTYQVTHGNYGPNQAWVASSKRVQIDLPTNFEFYDPSLYNCMGPRPRICNVNGTYKLKVFSRDYNPVAPFINAHPSEFYIYELDQYGNYSETAPLAAPVLYGHSGMLTVQLNKSYLVKHGVYSPNGYWTETRKTIHTFPSYGCGMYIDANSGEEIEYADQVAFDAMLSIDENEENGIQVFPNPTNGELNIKQENPIYQKVSVLDPVGRIVMNDLSLERGSIDISQLPTGTYILQLESTENGIKQVKIMKQ